MNKETNPVREIQWRRDLGVQLRRSIRLNWKELNELSGVTFDWSDIEYLVDLCTIYRERFCEPRPPDCKFPYHPKPTPRTERAAELAARRAFIEAVEGIWRDRRRKRGRGASYRHHQGKGVHDGPLLRLLKALFVAMREPNPPTPATLSHDLTALARGRERTRGR
jgi:hypothetical protein